MIIDSSAIVAILKKEPEAREFVTAIAAAERPRLSAATYVEIVNAVDRRMGEAALATMEEFLRDARIELVDFTSEQARWARHARVNYGAGRNEAGLNFGDCFSYALAKETGEPLLFKGNDFSKTDIKKAR